MLTHVVGCAADSLRECRPIRHRSRDAKVSQLNHTALLPSAGSSRAHAALARFGRRARQKDLHTGKHNGRYCQSLVWVVFREGVTRG